MFDWLHFANENTQMRERYLFTHLTIIVQQTATRMIGKSQAKSKHLLAIALKKVPFHKFQNS